MGTKGVQSRRVLHSCWLPCTCDARGPVEDCTLDALGPTASTPSFHAPPPSRTYRKDKGGESAQSEPTRTRTRSPRGAPDADDAGEALVANANHEGEEVQDTSADPPDDDEPPDDQLTA